MKTIGNNMPIEAVERERVRRLFTKISVDGLKIGRTTEQWYRRYKKFHGRYGYTKFKWMLRADGFYRIRFGNSIVCFTLERRNR